MCTGSLCSLNIIGVSKSYFPDNVTMRAAVFWTRCNLIKSLKSSYYTTIITENSTDQRVLFNTVSKLLQKQSTARYPSSCSDALANSFADYFIDKIDRIHATLIEKNSAQGNDANDVTLVD